MKRNVIAVFTIAALTTGCASTGANYTPIVDGPVSYGYSKDLEQCRAVARKRSYLNDGTKLKAVAGAAIGGALAAADAKKGHAGEDAIGGAIGGALVGLGSGAAQAHGERKQIVIQCLRGRGHKVVG